MDKNQRETNGMEESALGLPTSQSSDLDGNSECAEDNEQATTSDSATATKSVVIPVTKANRLLSTEEKSIKQRMKKHLKQRKKLRKYQTKVHQAMKRPDEQLITSSKNELYKYQKQLENDMDSFIYHQQPGQEDDTKTVTVTTPTSSSVPFTSSTRLVGDATCRTSLNHEHTNSSSARNASSSSGTATSDTIQYPVNETSPIVREARRWLLQHIWQPLIQHIKNDNTSSPSVLSTLKSTPPTDRTERKGVSIDIEKETSVSINGKNDNNMNNNNSENNKNCAFSSVQKTKEARMLLQNMTKGTQTRDMFKNDSALLGYTRYKFVERAMLSCYSIHRLFEIKANHVLNHNVANDATTTTTKHHDVDVDVDVDDDDIAEEEQRKLVTTSSVPSFEILQRRFLQTKQICSIGCGPGCDVSGILAYLAVVSKKATDDDDHDDDTLSKTMREISRLSIATMNRRSLVKRIVLMDYVIPQWKHFVLDDLASIWQSINIKSTKAAKATAATKRARTEYMSLVDHVDMISCDVRFACSHSNNCTSFIQLDIKKTNDVDETSADIRKNSSRSNKKDKNHNVDGKEQDRANHKNDIDKDHGDGQNDNPLKNDGKNNISEMGKGSATKTTNVSDDNNDGRRNLHSLLQQVDFSSIDMIIVSYLLTETRGQWKEFFDELLSHIVHTTRTTATTATTSTSTTTTGTSPSLSRNGSDHSDDHRHQQEQQHHHHPVLILLCEPTAWQLHEFLNMYGTKYIDHYVWLDSSRDTPTLQPLHGRIGPAVLLACTK